MCAYRAYESTSKSYMLASSPAPIKVVAPLSLGGSVLGIQVYRGKLPDGTHVAVKAALMNKYNCKHIPRSLSLSTYIHIYIYAPRHIHG